MGFFDVCGSTTVFGEQICVLYKYIEREAVTCDACFWVYIDQPDWSLGVFVFCFSVEGRVQVNKYI